MWDLHNAEDCVENACSSHCVPSGLLTSLPCIAIGPSMHVILAVILIRHLCSLVLLQHQRPCKRCGQAQTGLSPQWLYALACINGNHTPLCRSADLLDDKTDPCCPHLSLIHYCSNGSITLYRQWGIASDLQNASDKPALLLVYSNPSSHKTTRPL